MIENVAEIVAAFVKRNQVAAADLPALIASVSASISALTNPVPVAEVLTPAVPIKRSITPSAVVCLDCGWRGKMLRRHLSTRHQMTPEQYRRRWGLPLSHTLTAPAYTHQRSALAKSLGLGRLRRGAARTKKQRLDPVEHDGHARPPDRRKGRGPPSDGEGFPLRLATFGN